MCENLRQFAEVYRVTTFRNHHWRKKFRLILSNVAFAKVNPIKFAKVSPIKVNSSAELE